jgi:Uncharacterised nucleotidyltransferase
MTPLAEISAEADRLLAAARERGVPLRLLGGLAVQRHARRAPAALMRETGDIDLATVARRGADVAALLAAEGYAADEAVNALNGRRRLIFYDDHHRRKVDVFIGAFEMCHVIPVTDRLDVDPDTIPLAELVLTKLQIVELNEKDLRDLIALLASQPVGAGDDGINATRIAELLAEDWGLWRTSRENLGRIRAGLGAYSLSDADADRVVAACHALWEAVEARPKTRGWRMRARIGDRKRWYEQPEEVG